MRREISIVARGEEGPIKLMGVYFARCQKEDLLPLSVEFGAIVVEHKGKKVARMLLKGYAEDNKQEGGVKVSEIDKLVAKLKETGRFMITATILKPDGQMEHNFVSNNFPGNELLNAQFEHERLVRKEKSRIDKK